MSTYLLVHGAWHSATHWNKVEEHLTAMGHRVHAIDLPGSGLDAGYPQAYLRGDAEALATEPSPIGAVTLAVVFGLNLALSGLTLLVSAAVTPSGKPVVA